MFNMSLKKEALRIHEDTSNRYNASYKKMETSCEELYLSRQSSVELILLVEMVINSIANSPKEFSIEMGKVGREMDKFKETEDYAAVGEAAGAVLS